MSEIQKTEGRKHLEQIKKELAKESQLFDENYFSKHSLKAFSLLSYREEILQIWKTESRFRQGFICDEQDLKIPATFTIVNGYDENFYQEIKNLPNKLVIEDKRFKNKSKQLFQEKLKQKNQLEQNLSLKTSPLLKNNHAYRASRANFSDEIIDKHNKFDYYSLPPKLVVLARSKLSRINLNDLILLFHMGWDIIYLNPEGGGSLELNKINSEAVNIFNFSQNKKISKKYFIPQSIFKNPWFYHVLFVSFILVISFKFHFIWTLPLVIIWLIATSFYYLITKLMDWIGI